MLSDSLNDHKEEQDQNIRATLDLFKTEFDRAIDSLHEKQSSLEITCEELKCNQDMIREEMSTKGNEQKMNWEITQKVQSICKTLEEKSAFMQRDLDALMTTVNTLLPSEDFNRIVFDAPEKSQWFTGRENEMQSLQRCLPLEGSKELKMAAICGLGGCGKTTLAANYAWKHKQTYNGGVFWISMEDDKKFENSVSDLALRLEIQANTFDMTLSKVLTWISKRETPWLLVLDDVDQLDLSDQMHKVFRGRWKRQASGHVLVTTRREPKEICESINLEPSFCVEVSAFPEDVARRFLVARSGVSDATGQEQALDELVRELGCLPLALEQAGAHIKALQCSVSDYLEEFKIQRLNLLSLQPAKPSWEYESQTRLAVHTTWLLNFDYVRNSPHGDVASSLVQAAAFLAPNEIQLELINSRLLSADDLSCQSSNLPLIKNHIIETLTKFSLFQRKSSKALGLHRLVQEVIRNRMTVEETASSLLRAVQILHKSFRDFPSPDRILEDVAATLQEQPSASVANPSLFYFWSKLASHASEIQQHLKTLLEQQNIERENKTSVLTREASRVVYENAIHLSVHGHQEDAKESERFAFQILDSCPSDGVFLAPEDFRKWFPHTLPLTQTLQKTICYSSRPPIENQESASSQRTQVPSAAIDDIRLQGNALFKGGCFKEAIKRYTEAIEASEEAKHPDPRLLNNRATAHLKLGNFKKCLQDAEEYIKLMPTCWKGYTRKALALFRLGMRPPALCSAAMAYYHDSGSCRRYTDFIIDFKDLDGKWEIADSSEKLRHSLVQNKSEKSRKKVLLLTDAQYEIADGKSASLLRGGSIDITDTIMATLGNGSTVTINCETLILRSNCYFENIAFFVKDRISVQPYGHVEFHKCTFEKSVSDQVPVMSIHGATRFFECRVRDSKASGMFISGCNSSAALIKCQISGNGNTEDPYAYGIRVFAGGLLLVHECHIYGNTRGIWIDEGPLAGVPAKGAMITNSEIYDNKHEGVVVGGARSGVSPVIIMRRNKIYHNGTFGVRSTLNINDVLFENNLVFENLWWGICVHNNSGGLYKDNEICNNKMGGIMVGKRSPGKPACVVKNNFIHDNCGPAFHEGLRPSERYSFPEELQFYFLEALESAEGQYRVKNVSLPNVVLADFNANDCLRNNRGQTHFETANIKTCCVFCFRSDVQLKACTGCMTARYCGRKCQKLHWDKHRYTCKATGQRNAIEVPLPTHEQFMVSRAYVGLETTSPDYAPPPPSDGSRFIVKIQTLEGVSFKGFISLSEFVSDEQGPDKAELLIYDRSRHVNFYVKSKPQIYHLVMECGMLGVSMTLTKKLYFWAALRDAKTLRIFTHEFPQAQAW